MQIVVHEHLEDPSLGTTALPEQSPTVMSEHSDAQVSVRNPKFQKWSTKTEGRIQRIQTQYTQQSGS